MRRLRQIMIFIGGIVCLIGGAVLLVLPGPGLALIALGLIILATEFEWAKRLLDRLKSKLHH